MNTHRSEGKNNIIRSNSVYNLIKSDNLIDSSVINNFGTILSGTIDVNGKNYQILSHIARSGESDVYLASHNDIKYALKHYYTNYAPKKEVIDKLLEIHHPDIISLYDIGEIFGRFIEISEYAEGGTICEIMPVTSLRKIQEIVKEINEGLNCCHTKGIIHRDIKPENIFYRTSDKKDIAIGDFGIASNLQDGQERVYTNRNKSKITAAPEIYQSIEGKTILDKSVDYYALGITLLQLWIGEDPFKKVSEHAMMGIKARGQVVFPEDIDSDVKKLIKGLITVNPSERWGYNEVKGWLEGKDVKVLYHTIQFEYEPYPFGLIDGEQIVVINPKDLAGLLEKYPEKSEGHLYRNTIAKWIEPVDKGLFNELMDIVEKEFPKDRTAGLIKAIYLLDRERPFKGVDNTKLGTQEEIADYFENNFEHYQNELQNLNAGFYLFLEARDYKKEANEYRTYFKNHSPEFALNRLILELQGGEKYVIEKNIVYQPAELLNLHDKLLLKLIHDLSNENSKLSIWTKNFPNLNDTIDLWRLKGRYDITTFRYAFQEGFQLNESIAFSESEFYQLFKDKNDLFFSSGGSSARQNEANYWLLNYQNSSLTRIAINFLKSEKYSDNEFLLILSYILENHSDAKLNIYEVIVELLETIQNKTKDNTALQQRIIEQCAVNIEKTWVREQANARQLIDCINEYLSFSDANLSKFSDFLSPLTFKLNDTFSNIIRNEINQYKGNEKNFNDYFTNLKQCIPRLEKICSYLPYIKRHKDERNLIQYQNSVISLKLSDEKKSKIDITLKIYNDILTKKRVETKLNSKEIFLKKFIISLAIAIIAFSLLLATFNNCQNALIIFTIAWILLGIGIGIFVGLLYENLIVSIIGCLLFAWLGGKYGINIPVKYIYILCCLTVSIFGGRAILVNFKREKTICNIKLNSTEEDGLKQSCKSVDDFFNQRQQKERYDEKLRILLLNDIDFESEYNTKKTKFSETYNVLSYIVNQPTDYSKLLSAINIPVIRKIKVVNYSIGSLILLTLIAGMWKYATNENTYFSQSYYHNSSSETSELHNNTITYYYVSASLANMRQSPSRNGDLITILRQGTYVEVTSTSISGWYKVRYNGYEGYISSKLLTYGTNSKNNSTTPTNTTNEYAPENNNITPPSVVKDEEVKQKQYQWVTCSDCNGNGNIQANGACTGCKGNGQIVCVQCSGHGQYQCVDCKGEKKFICSDCKGVTYFVCSDCKGKSYFKCSDCLGIGFNINGFCNSCNKTGKIWCYSCNKTGKISCYSCNKTGFIGCYSCNKTGKLDCYTCNKTGALKCSNCYGKGQVTENALCPKCSGKGQIQQEL